MKFPLRFAISTLALLYAVAPAVQASGSVSVEFQEPQKFRDITDSDLYSARASQRVMDEIASYIKANAEPLLQDGQQLAITITEFDRAGEIRYYGATQQPVRTLTEVTWPSMTLQYTLSRDGVAGEPQQVSLADLDYKNRVYRPDADEPLFYEKKLIDRWIHRAFGQP